ncbi:hypothetical protein PWP93_33625 [Paraburkholderia sp. A1RI-2L]|uniref:hypothetical protein n=1 Tax=Paraburkholderia sp. A1RI-2L TaxID=3028367 RepID=UPI003B775A93
MHYFKYSFLVLLAICKNTFSEGVNLTIEDTALSRIDRKANAAIANDPSFSPFKNMGCKLAGTKIPLTPSLTVTTYFVTTENACGWGAALGPIWIVDESREKVILNTGGYAVAVKHRLQNGFMDIDVSSGTAGEVNNVYYYFNGNKYMSDMRRAKRRTK